LYLGNYDNVWDGFNPQAKLAELVSERRFTHVLNCAKESQNVYAGDLKYMHLPLVDEPTQSLQVCLFLAGLHSSSWLSGCCRPPLCLPASFDASLCHVTFLSFF
jgi:hypothetical protein